MKCSQKTCNNQASYWYSWIDGSELYCCHECLGRVKGISLVLGINPTIHQLPPLLISNIDDSAIENDLNS